jgi:glucan endo-1,3-alpha-glucosidase
MFCIAQVLPVTQAHALKDVQDALALGFDAFALNVADPTAQYSLDTLTSLFTAANTAGFKLFISMDLAAAANLGKTISDFNTLINDFKGNAAYYKGPNGYPFISTFSDGSLTSAQFLSWKATIGNMYFMPNLDRTDGYYTATTGWWSYWGGVIDGVFSWESAWPVAGAGNEGDVTQDNTVVAGCVAHKKTYMIRKFYFLPA